MDPEIQEHSYEWRILVVLVRIAFKNKKTFGNRTKHEAYLIYLAMVLHAKSGTKHWRMRRARTLPRWLGGFIGCGSWLFP